METLAVFAGQVVTMRGPARPRRGAEMSEIGLIKNGGILCEGGLVKMVGTRQEIEAALPKDATVIDEPDLVATPGLVDAHTHFVYAGSRAEEFEMRRKGATYQEIAAAGGGIRSTMRAVRETSEEDLTKLAVQHAKWMMRNGTTFAESKTGYGLDLENELKCLRAAKAASEQAGLPIYQTLLSAHAIPPELEGNKAGYLDLVLNEIIPAAAGFVSAVDMFVEKGYFDASDARALALVAKEHGLRLRLHVDQVNDNGGAALAADLGADTADHLEQTGPDGWKALLGSKTIPVLLPASVYGLGLKKYPDARAMIDLGLPVVVATDFNPGSSPCPSLPMAMSLACNFMGMSPAEALTACTVNAACTFGEQGAVRGKLEPGSRADISIFEANDYRELASMFGFDRATCVVVGGNQANLSQERIPR